MKPLIIILTILAALFAVAKELALPAVPGELRVPALRADYIGAHFWDAADWTDSMITDQAELTQNVANYLSVFPVMSGDSARVAAADTFLRRALADGSERALAVSQALEDCLFAAESQMRDERLYSIFLERMIAAEYPDSMRARYMLEMTRKNMPGTPAADFSFTDRKGTESSLRIFVDRPTIILFYDPDCHNCHDLAMAMADDPILKTKLISHSIKILAVSPGDEGEWVAHDEWLPDTWTDATDKGTIEEGELYDFGTFPALYLIGADGNVILKDCTPEQLIEAVTELR